MELSIHNVGKVEARITKNSWSADKQDGWLTLTLGIKEYAWDAKDKAFTHEEQITFFMPDVEATLTELRNGIDRALVVAREKHEEELAAQAEKEAAL